MAGRLLLVHAHPDDETITNGATMAKYVAEGVRVSLVTCTRGEQGEVIPPALQHLSADRDDTLGRWRERELAAAMSALGVADHRFLGAPEVSYRDSGMAYAGDGSVVPAADPLPDAFALAGIDGPASVLADVIREVRPHVVVTYEPGGGYGHPDHVHAHRVTMRAVDVAMAPSRLGWQVPKVYWVVRPDDAATTRVDGTAWTQRKVAALRCHATQLDVAADGSSYTLSNGMRTDITGVEYYRLVRGKPGPAGADGLEADLFAGITA